ncbi:MAG: sugar phosphate isomerase/epimerase [Clostridia bacterium]|nr:sugar phosphate isomerase/epimerase [Clostridia bacterium]
MNYKYGIAPVCGDTEEHLKIIRSVGFDATFTGWNHDKTEDFANLCNRLGLYYQSIHAPFRGVHEIWNDSDEGKIVLGQLMSCLDDCNRFDIPIMVVHPFIGFNDHTPTEAGLNNFSLLVDKATRLGVKLGFENVEGEEYLAAIMTRFSDCDAVGFCFDSGHQLCYNGSTDMMALYGDRLIHTHLNDNLGVTGNRITWRDDFHMPVGEGISDWREVMRKIRASGYTDVLMCELSLENKPDRHELDRYIEMPIEQFYSFALDRVKRLELL